MTGFRLALGGACERFSIDADLVTLGKVVGGGLPLAAFGGRREVMSRLSPQGPVYQAGTLSGNPLAVQAGLATLRQLTPDVYARLEEIGATVEAGIRAAVEAAGCSMNRVGSMLTVFFRSATPADFTEVGECDMAAFGRFHRRALQAGIYLPPSQYEAAFLSSTLSAAELKHLIDGLISALQD
jgi:glutamate-1-semialdehyde 2,1-aminomutase